MAVPDDLRRLSQIDSIFLGWSAFGSTGSVTSWYKGRVQQAADGGWIFRSISQDGSVIGYQLGFAPDAVRTLIAAFDGAWQSITTSGARLSGQQRELTRELLAKYIIAQARQGELDECRLRDGALLHLARSNLRRPPREQKWFITGPTGRRCLRRRISACGVRG